MIWLLLITIISFGIGILITVMEEELTPKTPGIAPKVTVHYNGIDNTGINFDVDYRLVNLTVGSGGELVLEGVRTKSIILDLSRGHGDYLPVRIYNEIGDLTVLFPENAKITIGINKCIGNISNRLKIPLMEDVLMLMKYNMGNIISNLKIPFIGQFAVFLEQFISNPNRVGFELNNNTFYHGLQAEDAYEINISISQDFGNQTLEPVRW
jgi:hypothetical protein